MLHEVKPLSTLIFKFLVEAKESEGSVERLMERFQECDGKWLMLEHGKICGYFMVSIQQNLYGKAFAFVENLYFNKVVRNKEAIRLMEKTIVDWTKAQGLEQIMFTTRRNARAFMKLLKTKFTIDSTVLIACV